MTGDDIEVTEENFGELLIKGLTEARAVAKGDVEPTRRVRRRLTARAAKFQRPRICNAKKNPGSP